jgi:hypothetical protein
MRRLDADRGDNGFTSREPPKPALSPEEEKRHLIYSVAEPLARILVFELVNKQPFIFGLFAAQLGNLDSVALFNPTNPKKLTCKERNGVGYFNRRKACHALLLLRQKQVLITFAPIADGYRKKIETCCVSLLVEKW